MNPLKSLLQQAASKRKISRHQLAIACGYQNVTKGLRHIDNYVERLVDTNNIAHTIQAVLRIPNDKYKQAIELQRNNLRAKSSQGFRPSLQVIFSAKVTSPIFAASYFLNIDIPSDLRDMLQSMPIQQANEHIFTLYQAHQLALFDDTKYVTASDDYFEFVANLESAERKNEKYFYGIGAGYRFHQQHHQSYTFDRYGRLVSEVPNGTCVAGLKIRNANIDMVSFF